MTAESSESRRFCAHLFATKDNTIDEPSRDFNQFFLGSSSGAMTQVQVPE